MPAPRKDPFDEPIQFLHNGITYRTNRDASVVEGRDGKTWNRTYSLAVRDAARKAIELRDVGERLGARGGSYKPPWLVEEDKKTPAQLQREIDEVLAKSGRTGRSHATQAECPVEVGDFVSFQSKHDGSTVKGRVVEVAWLDDHWSAMVKMAGHPGNAIVHADELTKLSKRAHATVKKTASSPAQLFVEGRGHPVKNGYAIYWNWKLYRDGQKVDAGALSSGDLPEFYETRPDYRAQKAMNAEMKKQMREWIRSGEFGSGVGRATKIFVSSTLPL